MADLTTPVPPFGEAPEPVPTPRRRSERPAAVSRRALKHVVAGTVHALGGLDLLRTGRRVLRGPAVRIFGWHRVVRDVRQAARHVMPPMCTSVETFEAHLAHLRSHYAVWSLADAALALAGRRSWPDRDIAVVTFDDGYRDILENAAPLLARWGLPATMFVSTGAIEQGFLMHDRIHALCARAAARRARLLAMAAPPGTTWALARADYALMAGDVMGAAEAILLALPRRLVEELGDALARRFGDPVGDEIPQVLSWDEVRSLRDLGVQIGSHTETHAHLVLEDDDSLALELAASRQELAVRLGAPPDTIAYPAGRHDERVVAATRRAGYRIAVTTEDRPSRPGMDPLRLGRKIVHEGHGLGVDNRTSRTVVAAQLDGLFTLLGQVEPVAGDLRFGEPLLDPSGADE